MIGCFLLTAEYTDSRIDSSFIFFGHVFLSRVVFRDNIRRKGERSVCASAQVAVAEVIPGCALREMTKHEARS